MNTIWKYGRELATNPSIVSCALAMALAFFYRPIFSYAIDGGGKRFDVWILLIIVVVFTFSFKIFWENSLKILWKDLKPCSRVDAIFIVVTFFLLFLPATRVNFAEKDVIENRMLAKLPSVWENNGKINLRFGSQMEAWISDRFAGRSKLLAVHDYLDYVVGGARYETSRAFVGKNDWLFYKGNNSVKLFQNRLAFSDKELMTIRDNLVQQYKWLESKGIGYVVFVAPNKEDVYSEFYPDGICKIRTDDRVMQLNKFLEAENCPICIIYPLDELLSHKNDGLLYYKNDTHWNKLGAYYGYCALMAEIKKKVEVNELLLDKMTVKKEVLENGDLNPMLPRAESSCYRFISYNAPSIEESKMVQEGDGNILQTCNPDGKHKAIVFRDSFGMALIPYLSESFGEVIYIKSHDLERYAEMIEKEKPDIVIHEMVSRYASSMLTETPHWRSDGGPVNGF